MKENEMIEEEKKEWIEFFEELAAESDRREAYKKTPAGIKETMKARKRAIKELDKKSKIEKKKKKKMEKAAYKRFKKDKSLAFVGCEYEDGFTTRRRIVKFVSPDGEAVNVKVLSCYDCLKRIPLNRRKYCADDRFRENEARTYLHLFFEPKE